MSSRHLNMLLLILISAVFIRYSLHYDHKKAAAPPAFLCYTTGFVLIKVIDPDGYERLYRFPDGSTLTDVKKMTDTDASSGESNQAVGIDMLMDGDIVDLSRKKCTVAGFARKHMELSEKIILGIPLDPDKLSQAEWMLLPGIGRGFAKAIADERQKNGNYESIENVSRVPGMSSGKINSLKKYFNK